jgi:hypothetical protein
MRTYAILLVLSSILQFVAHAEEIDVRGSLYDFDCVSTFEGKQTSRVKVVDRQASDETGVTKLILRSEWSAQGKRHFANFRVTKATYTFNSQLTVEAISPLGNKLKIVVDQSNDRESSEARDANLFVNGKQQDFLKLQCTNVLAG